MSSPISSPRSFSAPADLTAAIAISADVTEAPEASSYQASASGKPAASSLSALDRLISQHQARFHRRVVPLDGSEPAAESLSTESAEDSAEVNSEGSWDPADLEEDLQSRMDRLQQALRLGNIELERVRQNLNEASDDLDRMDLTSAELLEIAQRGHAQTEALLADLESSDEVVIQASDSGTADVQGSGRSSPNLAEQHGDASPATPDVEIRAGDSKGAAPASEASVDNAVAPVDADRTEEAASARPPAQPQAPGTASVLQRALGFFRSLGAQIASLFQWIFSGLFSGRAQR